MKLFSNVEKTVLVQFKKCDCSGHRGEPYDVLNGIIDREKDASRVCFLIQERMVHVEYLAQENVA